LSDNSGPEMQEVIDSVFKSIYKIPDVQVGFTSFDKSEGKFSNKMSGKKIRSFLLSGKDEGECNKILSKASYQNLINDHEYFAVSDLSSYSVNDPNNIIAAQLLLQNIKSIILAPVIKDGTLLGILEVVS